MFDLLPTALKGAVLGGAGLVGVAVVTLAGRLGLWLLRGTIRLVGDFREFRKWRRRGPHGVDVHGQADGPDPVAVVD